jgi:hypothetical protein
MNRQGGAAIETAGRQHWCMKNVATSRRAADLASYCL